ncbi:MAG: hypothetical protein WBD90_18170, partial [Xanthobacteraceae bacterium]
MVVGCSPAASQSVSQVVVFGDSTIDSGWYRNAAPNSTNPTYNTDFAIAVTQGGGTATTKSRAGRLAIAGWLLRPHRQSGEYARRHRLRDRRRAQ